jgi:uncharacterized repeat protein (TIGR01451 family)
MPARGRLGREADRKRARIRRVVAGCALGLLVGAAPVLAEVVLQTSVVKVESVLEANGRVKRQLLPADEVVAGEELRYTITFRNDSDMAVEAGRIVITNPLPDGTRYVAGSAGGDDTRLEFSADGESFSTAEPADVRALRWTYQGELRPGDDSDVFFHVRMQ